MRSHVPKHHNPSRANDHVARYAAVADTDIDTAVVALADPEPHSVESLGRLIERLAER